MTAGTKAGIQDTVNRLSVDKSEGEVEAIENKGMTDAQGISPFTHLSVIETLRRFPKAIVFSTLAALGAMSDGYQFSTPGSIIANEGFIHEFGEEKNGKWAIDPFHISAWSGVYTGTYIFVLLFGPLPADLLGRRWCLFLVQVLLACACIVEMFANDWRVWMVAKILNGFAIGLNQCTAIPYISEIAPVNGRGALLGAYQLWFAMGQFAASIGMQVLVSTTPLHWRRAIYSEWVFTGIALIGWLFLPESPCWLSSKGKHDAAKAVLHRINGQVEGYDVELEYGIISAEIEAGRRLAAEGDKMSLFAIFKGTNLRRTFISFMPFAFQTWSGNPIVFGYTAYFFKLAGLKYAFGATVAVYTILVVFIMISFYVTERVGRRPLLLAGGSVCCACMFIIAGVSFRPFTEASGTVLVTFACLWTASYALSIGPVGYAYLGETSQIFLRGRTTGFAAASAGILNLVSNYCTPLMLNNPSFTIKGTALFFACTGSVCLVIVYFAIPETRARTYAELDELFAAKVSARKFASTKTTVDLAREAGTV